MAVHVHADQSRGRSTSGQVSMTGVRLPVLPRTKLDKWADKRGVTRSEAVRRILGSTPDHVPRNAIVCPFLRR
jgi:hypothetical protein